MLEKILTREIITTLCSIVIGYILYKIVSKIITKFLISKIGKDRKKQTMIGIINNIVKYFFLSFLYFTFSFFLLSLNSLILGEIIFNFIFFVFFVII